MSIRSVALSLSGGVDSAVAGLLLLRKGFNVTGIFQNNWNAFQNEFDDCDQDAEYNDATRVADTLGIKLLYTDFSKEYWNHVFRYTLDSYSSGYTPNPDVLCNQHIKFGTFFDYAIKNIGCDAIATGHYAGNSYGAFLEDKPSTSHAADIEPARLLIPKDTMKDQTLFLSRIPQRSLQRTMFPLSTYIKQEVRAIAADVGLHNSKKRDSTGMCFIGKRCFADFIDQYLEKKTGNFINYETGQILGTHTGTHHFTVGQGARLPGMSTAHYIHSMDVTSQTIYVVPNSDNPLLYSNQLICANPYWITEREPITLSQPGSKLKCGFKFMNMSPIVEAEVEKNPDGIDLTVTLSRPLRALTPGQFATFYSDNECLGSAVITETGPSLRHLGSDYYITSDGPGVTYAQFS